MKTFIRTLAVFGVLAVSGRATLIDIDWNFSGGSGLPSSIDPTITGGAFSGNNQFLDSSWNFNSSNNSGGQYAGASGGHNASIAAVDGALNPVTSTYFDFTIAPTSGRALVVTGFDLGSRSTDVGPTTLTLTASTDGGTTFNTVWTVTVPTDFTWNLASNLSPSIFNDGIALTAPVDTAITFRLYGTGGTGASAASNWRIDDVELDVVAIPEPPTYAAMLVGVALLGLRRWRRRQSPVA